MAWYLMIKTAEGIGVRYLCKCGDYKDPYKYKGSGVFWRKIINKHKCIIHTEILGKYETKEELRSAGEYYSKLFNIVEDRSWANLIPEIGDGGPTVRGRIRVYNLLSEQQKFIENNSPIPEGWARGSPKWKKSAKSKEKTRAFHTGRIRSEETRNRMKNAKRRKRMTVECSSCHQRFTCQNIERHRKGCISEL